MEFHIDIDPTSLASRILSVREQLADEWVRDLATLRNANDQILDSYREKSKKARDQQKQDTNSKSNNDNTDHDSDANNDNSDVADDDTSSTVPYSHFQRPDKDDAFDRIGTYLLRNSMAGASTDSSPLRKGTFDLLLLMATQESVHRVLRSYSNAGDKRWVSFEWFLEYYTERAHKTFDGVQEYGRADDFLQDLLLTPPLTKTVGKRMELVDPLRIAEEVLHERGEVLMDYERRVATVKDDHVILRKELLNQQMAKWGSGGIGDGSDWSSSVTTTIKEPETETTSAGAANTNSNSKKRAAYGEFE